LRAEQRALLIVEEEAEKLISRLEERVVAGGEWQGREVI